MIRKNRPVPAVVGALALAGLLAGCAGGADSTGEATGGSGSGAFPVTITSALGDAVIESEPTRVATWGWGATDAVLALGIVPIAIGSDDYSGGDDLVNPWNADKIEELGGEAPTILDQSTYELSVEELLETEPDVLLAPYSGLTQEEFDTVTAAGVPVVAYPRVAWDTTWEETIALVGEALGQTEEAADLVTGMKAEIAEAAEAHPEFAGTSIAFLGPSTDGSYYAYTAADPRVQILEGLGFVTPDSITALDPGDGSFYVTLSAENLDAIDADVILTQAESQDVVDSFVSSDTGQLIPAVKAGAVASIVGAEETSALTPTPLALPWILPTLVAQLADATAAAQG
ncbi:ABC transporter substrate-binding protein [Microbacterium sp. 18062]|uniref:ABC transporter substrate-binding protein n=1 Tax=Microbacterium sp. 18062 TaxID=2681410 RepID=UPI001358CE16|nr:ABC transporter substrate-binding protein [Microbacterium sp. 18062]